MRLILLLALLGTALAADSWKTVNVDRIIDVTTQVVKIGTVYTFENAGTASEKTVKIALTKQEQDNLALISASIEGTKNKLKITKDSVTNGLQTYTVDLRTPTAQGQQVKVKISLRVTKVLEPLPAKIPQGESQFVVYHGDAYIASIYPVAAQKTTIRTTAGGKLLSATTVNPSKQETERVIYGPYSNVAALESKPIKVHYENNSPFVVATVVERLIEVSHWGNIAVEEYIELVHKGAELDGTFSRLDYQMDRRGRKMPALQQFTTILPAGAKDIYYRDEIGNISTSAVRIRADSVDLELRPRFPLFGGWKTSYVIGYNVPSEDYLYSSGNQYALKMRLFDNVFDSIVVEKLVTKVILPEHVKKIKVATPYVVDRKPDELKPTYLDTTGRLVIIMEKLNVVHDHIQPFTLTYEFEFKDMLREPLLATLFFFALFAVIIVYARFDFSIASDPAKDAEERAQRTVESLSKHVDFKQNAYTELINATIEYKSTKDEAALAEAKKEFNNTRNNENNKLNDKIAHLKDAGAIYEKALELVKYDKPLFDSVETFLKAVEKSSSKSGGPEEQAFLNKVKEARTRADSLLAAI